MKKIVLVDDYTDFMKMQKALIRLHSDNECVTFTNPLEALKYMQEEKNVDVLVTDYQMPQMNGFELAREVCEKLPQVRIIVSSGHDVATLQSISENYGLDGKIAVMTKGIDIECFLDMIDNA